MNGKAAIFLGAGKGYQIEELPVPDPEPDGIVIKVSMAGICGSDLHIWRGDSPAFAMMVNQVVGHEMTGRVYKLGARISTDSLGRPLKEGDRVCYAYFYPCNRCYQCNKGEFAACPSKVINMMPTISRFAGAYGEYYYLKPGGWVFKVPDELSDEVVAPLNCALSQVTYGLSVVGLKLGDTLVIQGLGGLGLNACAVGKEMGAECVIAIDGIPARLEAAKRFGADLTVDIREHNTPEARVQQVLALTGQRGADVVAEVVGFPDALPEAVQMVRNGGALLEIGNISFGNTTSLDPAQLVWGSRRIYGVVMYDPWVIPEALDFLVRTRNKYPFDKIASHKYKLEDINKAFEEAEWKAAGKEKSQITRAFIVP
jgi:D-arabinose 1-dehydrogenase-like Zn-dependent alcohol dehydrogenase